MFEWGLCLGFQWGTESYTDEMILLASDKFLIRNVPLKKGQNNNILSRS